MNFYLAKAKIEKKAFFESIGQLYDDMRLIKADSPYRARLKYEDWIKEFNRKNNVNYVLHDIEIIETII